MRRNVDEERLYFWKRYEELLTKKGNPYTINYTYNNTIRPQAVINRLYNPKADKVLEVCFLSNKQKLRIDLYIRDDILLWEKLREEQEQINKELQDTVEWTAKGIINPNTRRIQMFLSLKPYERSTYDEAIEQSIRSVARWITVLEKYVPNLFDKK